MLSLEQARTQLPPVQRAVGVPWNPPESARAPDASQVEQQHVLLDGDGGGGFGEVDGGVDAAQVARLQAVLPQQVAPPHEEAPRLAGGVQPQYLGGLGGRGGARDGASGARPQRNGCRVSSLMWVSQAAAKGVAPSSVWGLETRKGSSVIGLGGG